MTNTLIAAGPDFKAGFVDKLPSGNSDVTPTVAYLLGIPAAPGNPMDGRVLSEALTTARFDQDAKPPETRTLLAKHTLLVGDKKERKEWSQYLKVTTYAGRRYYDEGNTLVVTPTTAPATTRPATAPANPKP
jgi:hypothetical protein